MRASLDVLGWAFHFSLARNEPAGPQRQGDVYAVAERAELAGEDVRMPSKTYTPGAGFQGRMEAMPDPYGRRS